MSAGAGFKCSQAGAQVQAALQARVGHYRHPLERVFRRACWPARCGSGRELGGSLRKQLRSASLLSMRPLQGAAPILASDVRSHESMYSFLITKLLCHAASLSGEPELLATQPF